MRFRSTALACSLVSIATAVPLLSAAMHQPEQQKGATLLKIVETRVATVAEKEGAAEDEFGFNMNEATPGLLLTFQVTVPGGRQLLEVSQPSRLEAQDAEGNDLSEIEPGFTGEKEYIDIPMTFGDDPNDEITFQLGQPARSAAHFSLDATFNAIIYSGTQDEQFELGDEWSDLNSELLGDENIQARFGQSQGMFSGSIGVQMRPATAQRYIEKIAITLDGQELESSGSVSTSESITYTVNRAEVEESATAQVTLTLRTGLEEMPVRIRLQDQELP